MAMLDKSNMSLTTWHRLRQICYCWKCRLLAYNSPSNISCLPLQDATDLRRPQEKVNATGQCWQTPGQWWPRRRMSRELLSTLTVFAGYGAGRGSVLALFEGCDPGRVCPALGHCQVYAAHIEAVCRLRRGSECYGQADWHFVPARGDYRAQGSIDNDVWTGLAYVCEARGQVEKPAMPNM